MSTHEAMMIGVTPRLINRQPVSKTFLNVVEIMPLLFGCTF
jgi:hypothetical protein